MSEELKACVNTDKEIWRGPDDGCGDAYANSVHITKGGGLGINCGGRVYVLPIREWHRLAALRSSQSTSDAGGGVPDNLSGIIEDELKAWRGTNGGVYTIHAAALAITKVVRAALSNPAAADSNTSVEARLREALGEIKLIALTAGAPGGLDVHFALSRIVRLCRDAGVTETMTDIRKALSSDPHASDCARDGESMGDISPGDPKDLKELLSTPSVLEPSDRTADVTVNPDGLCDCTWTCEKRDNCRDRARNTVGRR